MSEEISKNITLPKSERFNVITLVRTNTEQM